MHQISSFEVISKGIQSFGRKMIARFASICIYTLILVHQINALSDDTIRSNDVQSFWFNYINQTLNLLQDVINKEMTQNNNVSHLCNKHFMELISNARNGEHWANKSKSYLSKCKSGT